MCRVLDFVDLWFRHLACGTGQAGSLFHFAVSNNVKPVTVAPIVGDAANFIPENAEIAVNFLEGNPIGIDLPLAMTMSVKSSEAGVKGDRVSGATKLATLETGHQIQVPIFIHPGDRIRVDTRSGNYIGKE